jgi:hypothetical protein
MRENCTYGSEGGEARAFPTPINAMARPLMANLCFIPQDRPEAGAELAMTVAHLFRGVG